MILCNYHITPDGMHPIARLAARMEATKERSSGRYPTDRERAKIRRAADTAICGAIARHVRDMLAATLEGYPLLQAARLHHLEIAVSCTYQAPSFELTIAAPWDGEITQRAADELRALLWNTLHTCTTYEQTCKPFRDWLAALPEKLPA